MSVRGVNLANQIGARLAFQFLEIIYNKSGAVRISLRGKTFGVGLDGDPGAEPSGPRRSFESFQNIS